MRVLALALAVPAALFVTTIWYITRRNEPWVDFDRGFGVERRFTVWEPTYMSLETAHGGSDVSADRAVHVESLSNPYGFMNLIDPFAGNVFNPTILVMPKKVRKEFRYLMVSRGKENYEVIDGEDTRWQTVLGCFLNPVRRVYGQPLLERRSDLTTLDLPSERKPPYQRCEDHVFDQFIGPEDPRLFFTNKNQPMLIYSQTGRSPMICRALYIIDARAVIPGLKEAMRRAGLDPPIEIPDQKDLIRENQYNIEKNWAPFVDAQGDLMFHVSLVPQKIYKFSPQLVMRPLDTGHDSSTNCLTDIIASDAKRTKLHHATPLLSVTLCKRGTCRPNVHNTILFAFIHVKYFPDPYLFYERRVVTWNMTAPHNYISVSKPIVFSGVNQGDPVFTVSTAWAEPKSEPYNHGYLDDPLITSFGVFDFGSAYIDHLAVDVLSEHRLCRADFPEILNVLKKPKP